MEFLSSRHSYIIPQPDTGLHRVGGWDDWESPPFLESARARAGGGSVNGGGTCRPRWPKGQLGGWLFKVGRGGAQPDRLLSPRRGTVAPCLCRKKAVRGPGTGPWQVPHVTGAGGPQKASASSSLAPTAFLGAAARAARPSRAPCGGVRQRQGEGLPVPDDGGRWAGDARAAAWRITGISGAKPGAVPAARTAAGEVGGVVATGGTGGRRLPMVGARMGVGRRAPVNPETVSAEQGGGLCKRWGRRFAVFTLQDGGRTWPGRGSGRSGRRHQGRKNVWYETAEAEARFPSRRSR